MFQVVKKRVLTIALRMKKLRKGIHITVLT